MPKTNIKVKLIGEDGNAFLILGKVAAALKDGGHPELVEPYKVDATASSYDHLLQVTMEYVEVE